MTPGTLGERLVLLTPFRERIDEKDETSLTRRTSSSGDPGLTDDDIAA